MAFQVLVLCTGNSARSLLAECALNRRGAGRLVAHSAGSHPRPAPHPMTLELLARRGFDTSGLRSKSWSEFAGPDAPRLDLVITVCGDAARETCPMWSGAPLQAHWGVDDPAGTDEASQREAFERAWRLLDARVEAFVALDFESLPPDALRAALDRIARIEPASPGASAAG